MKNCEKAVISVQRRKLLGTAGAGAIALAGVPGLSKDESSALSMSAEGRSEPVKSKASPGLPSVQKAYAPSRFGQLHYRIATPGRSASAPALLCLHMTPRSSREWLPIMAHLAKRRVVIAPDNPGYGMSDAPPAPISIEDFATVMADFMRFLARSEPGCRGAFDVLGYHTGSIIATEMARALPGRVRRLALFGLAAYPADVRAQRLATLRDKFPVPDKSLRHVEQQWALMQGWADKRIAAEAVHISMADGLALGSRLPWAYEAVYRYDFLGAMPQVRQPVLVFNPEDDLYDVTRRTSQLFPNGKRLDMPGVSHGVLEIERDRVVREIETFLA